MERNEQERFFLKSRKTIARNMEKKDASKIDDYEWEESNSKLTAASFLPESRKTVVHNIEKTAISKSDNEKDGSERAEVKISEGSDEQVEIEIPEDRFLIGWENGYFHPIQELKDEEKLKSTAKKFLGGKVPQNVYWNAFGRMYLSDIEEIKSVLKWMEEVPALIGIFSHTLYSMFIYYDYHKEDIRDYMSLNLHSESIDKTKIIADIFCNVLSDKINDSALSIRIDKDYLKKDLKKLTKYCGMPVIFTKNNEITVNDKNRIDNILQKEKIKVVPVYINSSELKIEGVWDACFNGLELPKTVKERVSLKTAIHSMIYIFLWNLENLFKGSKKKVRKNQLERFEKNEISKVNKFCRDCYVTFSYLLKCIENAAKSILTDDDKALLERTREKAEKYLLVNQNKQGEKEEELTDKEYISSLYDFIQEELKKNESLINKAEAVVLCQPDTGKMSEENEEYYWLKTKTYAGAFLEYMKKEKEYTGEVRKLAESVREALKSNKLIKWDKNNISWSRRIGGEKNSYIMLNKEKFDKFVDKENQ